MTLTFLGSALARCAATAYFVPVASRQDRFTALHYNAVDVLICGVTSHYIMKDADPSKYNWLWQIVVTRAMACMAGVAVTKAFSSRPMSFINAVTINIAASSGACAVALLSHHLFEKSFPCKDIW